MCVYVKPLLSEREIGLKYPKHRGRSLLLPGSSESRTASPYYRPAIIPAPQSFILMRSRNNELGEPRARTCVMRHTTLVWNQRAGSGSRIGIDGGISVGTYFLPPTQASTISDHSCIMWRRCTSYSALL